MKVRITINVQPVESDNAGRTRPASDNYRDNYDRIFGEKKSDMQSAEDRKSTGLN